MTPLPQLALAACGFVPDFGMAPSTLIVQRYRKSLFGWYVLSMWVFPSGYDPSSLVSPSYVVSRLHTIAQGVVPLGLTSEMVKVVDIPVYVDWPGGGVTRLG